MTGDKVTGDRSPVTPHLSSHTYHPTPVTRQYIIRRTTDAVTVALVCQPPDLGVSAPYAIVQVVLKQRICRVGIDKETRTQLGGSMPRFPVYLSTNTIDYVR